MYLIWSKSFRFFTIKETKMSNFTILSYKINYCEKKIKGLFSLTLTTVTLV